MEVIKKYGGNVPKAMNGKLLLIAGLKERVSVRTALLIEEEQNEDLLSGL